MNIIRNWKFHPFLISIYPVLALVTWNYGLLRWSDVFRSLAIILAIVTLILGLFYKIQHSLARPALYVSLSTTLFFSYGHLLRWLNSNISGNTAYHLAIFMTGLWLSIWMIGLWKLLRGARLFEEVTVFCNVFSLVLIGSMLLQIGWMELQRSLSKQDVLQSDLSMMSLPVVPDHQTPDIYYIVLDSYTRGDVFLDTFYYDNSAFISHLKKQGFFVADNSYSNYGGTILSISSTLNFDYLRPITMGPNSQQLDYRAYREILNQNRVMQFLKQQGYEIVTIESGYDLTELKNSDLYVQFPPDINPVESSVLEYSFSGLFVQNWLTPTFRENFPRYFSSIGDLAGRPSPKFVFFHVLALHNPFLFDHNGVPLDRGVAQFDGYREQVGYVNRLVEEMVSNILKNSSSEPVIILQGDHGPHILNQPGINEKECLQDHFSILNAIYLPDNRKANLYHEISPVNTFRLVFNTIFGTDLNLLKDESYNSLFEPAYNFVHHTGQPPGCSSETE